MLLNKSFRIAFVICLVYYAFKKTTSENRVMIRDFCVKLVLKWLSH